MKPNGWLKLSNSARVHIDLIGAVSTFADSFRIFIRGRNGDTLAAIQLEDEDAYQLEIEHIDKQLG